MDDTEGENEVSPPVILNEVAVPPAKFSFTVESIVARGVPEDMAKRLAVLGNDATVEVAIKSFVDRGFWYDVSGGGAYGKES